MLFRDLRVADRQSAATRRIDQHPGLVTVRVLEGRASGAASERLRFFAGASDRVHLRRDRSRVARLAAEGRFDDDRAFGDLAVAIGVAELFERQFDKIARAKDQLRGDEDVAHFAAISAAVHPYESAHRAGDATEKFEAGDSGIPRG